LTCTDLVTTEQINDLVNGEIDERKWLPTAGFTIRPWEGITLRGAWSRTVARPSFRELGFYISVEPGTDDETVGNPQLRLSEVESFDVRAEFTWGDLGDLVAVSAFQKTIDSPIERIVIRNQSSFEDVSGSFVRTFFNNPNEADLKGLEFEFRKNFGFLNPEWIGHGTPWLEWLQYLSVGGNYTWIDAEVGRTEAELARAEEFFLTCDEDTVAAPFCFFSFVDGEFDEAPRGPGRYSGLAETRRLFNQPEWIVNLDLSFDHPDWGTKWAVSFFAISDILDAAGGASSILPTSGDVEAFLFDRYVDSFYQIDATFSQRIPIPTSWGKWELPGPGDHALTFSASVKNLTDSRRRIIYDPEQTAEDIAEREFRVGRDYSFSLTYSFSF
jgi:outer membrane receptor protein involved in Fe transport